MDEKDEDNKAGWRKEGKMRDRERNRRERRTEKVKLDIRRRVNGGGLGAPRNTRTDDGPRRSADTEDREDGRI